MEIRVLRYLVAVVDAGTIAAAARDVLVAQPSLSRQLRAFERQLGFSVFDRRANRLTLTPAGAEFVERARRFLREADALQVSADHLADGIATRLQLSAPRTLIDDLVAPFIAHHLGENDPHLDVVAVPTNDRFAGLDTGTDIAIASGKPPAWLASRLLGSVPLFAQVPSGHPWACRDSVHLHELAGQQLFIVSDSHRTRVLINTAIHRGAGGQHSFTECESAGSAQALAAAGRGVAVLTDLPRFGLSIVPLSNDSGPLAVHCWAAWQADHYAAEFIQDMTDRISAYYKKIVGSASSA